MSAAPKVRANLLDRAIAVVAPRLALKRLAARHQYTSLAGGYTGARRDKSSLSQWFTRGRSADSAILPDLPLLRERSRDLVRNAPLACGAINTVVTNVVGTGLKLQPSIDREVLGLDENAADAWERAALREWELWSRSPECDLSRTLDFAGFQDLSLRSVLESGDVFLVMRFLERPGSPFGLKLAAIEADRVSNPDWRLDGSRQPDGNVLVGGVELDGNKAPVAFHIQDEHPHELRFAGSPKWTRVPAFGSRTGRRNVLHLFKPLRPGQRRGVPYLAPVIESLKQLDRYTEAEIMAAVVSSMFTVFVKTETGEGLEPVPGAGVGQATSDDDYRMGNGAILDLRPNESVETANPGRPNQAFDPFVMAVLRQIGVALELPFEVLIKHFTASYSAARAAILEAWRFYRSRRAWLATWCCAPVYEALITESVARGRLSAPGFFDDPLLRMAWLGSDWVGDAMGQLDPNREMEAAEKKVSLGISTLAEQTAEITGGDWERKHAQRAKEVRRRQEDGLGGPSAASAAPNDAPAPARPDDTADTEREDEA